MTQLLIAGKWMDGDGVQTLTDRYAGKTFGTMAIANEAQVDQAIESADRAVTQCALAPYRRYEILSDASRLLLARAEEFIALMRDEAGFTRADGDNEVRRCVQTLELSAEEAKRLSGEIVPMTAAKGVTHRMGYTIRVPKGVICAITPFNSPLNTLAHKVAPALAGGNAVIVKPSTYTPLSAVAFCKVLIDAGLPAELLSLVYGPSHTVARRLLAHPKVAYYAFTGSTRVGREIQQAAGLRGTQLELGSIASTIVCSDADLERALPKIVNAGYRKAGQVCTSVQRLFVARSLSETFTKRFVSAVKALPAGDPADPKTVVGPMISEEHAIRAADWIQEAVAQGATLLCGGGRKGSVLEPTILSGVKSDMKVVCEEVFAPVVCLIEFDTLDEAITAANDSPYGLAAGIFTNDLRAAFQAAGSLNFGGIHINEASSARVDVMPFGGVKESGFGREGPAYAIREMTEERLVTFAF